MMILTIGDFQIWVHGQRRLATTEEAISSKRTVAAARFTF